MAKRPEDENTTTVAAGEKSGDSKTAATDSKRSEQQSTEEKQGGEKQGASAAEASDPRDPTPHLPGNPERALTGPGQDELNPAYAPPKEEPTQASQGEGDKE